MEVNRYPRDKVEPGTTVASVSETPIPRSKPLPSMPRSASAYTKPTSPLSGIAPAPNLPRNLTGESGNWGGNAKPPRPTPERRTTLETRYVEMLLSQGKISRWHNICAHFFTWILLAGYLVFPATFTTLTDKISVNGEIGQILGTFKNGPWLYVAAIACGVGVLGMFWLWMCHRKNYVWVINRIFLPGFTNALAGLISTLVNIYTAENGQYSITAKATTIVTGACSLVLALLFLLYNSWALSRVKAKHRQEIEQAALRGEEKEDKAHDGVIGTVMRKVHDLDNQGTDPLSIV